MSENQKRLHVQHYYSTNKNSVPEVKVEGVDNENALIDGEMAINHADEKLFIKKNGATDSNDVVTFSSDEKLDERYAPKKDYVVNGENEHVHVSIERGEDSFENINIKMGGFDYNVNGSADSANGIGILVENNIDSSGLIVESGYVKLTGETESGSSSTNGGSVKLFDETVCLNAWNNSDGDEEKFDNTLTLNRNGLIFNESRVVTEQILGEHDELVKVDENGVANKSEITIGTFEIKNDKQYNYTLEGSFEDRDGNGIIIEASYDGEPSQLVTVYPYDNSGGDETDWCYKFIVTSEHDSTIPNYVYIPSALIDSDYKSEYYSLLNFTEDVSETFSIYTSHDGEGLLNDAKITRSVPFSLKHTSKVLLNGSPIVTDKKLSDVTGAVETVLGKVDAIEKSLGTDGDTGKAIAAAQSAADNAQKEVDALEKSVASEIARVESEVEDNYLRKVVDDNSSNFITFQEALFSVDLDTPACSSTLKYEIIQSGDGEIPSLTIDGMEIATHDYVKNIISGGIKFRGIYTELPWNENLTFNIGDGGDFDEWKEENLQGFNEGDLIIIAPKHEEEYNEQYGGNPSADPSKEYILTEYETDDAYHYHWELLGETTAVDKRITDEVNRATSAEKTLTTNLNNEVNRATSAEKTLTTNLNNEINRAKGEEGRLSDRIGAIEGDYVPSYKSFDYGEYSSEESNIIITSEYLWPGVQSDVYSQSTIYLGGDKNGRLINLSATDEDDEGNPQHYELTISAFDGVKVNGRDVITKGNASENGVLVVDENGIANKSEITIGSFEIKNDKPYNYTLEGFYEDSDGNGIVIEASYDGEPSQLVTVYPYDNSGGDEKDWCYKFIVTSEHDSTIPNYVYIPSALIDDDYKSEYYYSLLNFTEDVSETFSIYTSHDAQNSLSNAKIIRSVPFSLKHTSKALLNGSPVVTEEKLGKELGHITDNVETHINEIHNEINRVESEGKDNYLRKVIDESPGNYITFDEGIFSINLYTPASESVLTYGIIQSDNGETPSLTIDGKEIATVDMLSEGGNITIDSELNTTSTNPVQNKVITNKINELVEKNEEIESNFAELNGKIDSSKLILTTWSNLNSLKNANKLIPGTKYRITDYVATSITENTTCKTSCKFDIIVMAISVNELDEVATTISKDGVREEIYKIWYSLKNDSERFAWADTTNGKGVIYRMIDKYNNDAPYDFRNILFKKHNEPYYIGKTVTNFYKISENDELFTFSYFKNLKSDILDGTLYGLFSNNKIEAYYIDGKQYLNNNILISYEHTLNKTVNISNIILGKNCYNNTLSNSNDITFNTSCYSNYIVAYSSKLTSGVIFEHQCHDNMLCGFGYDIKFGGNCAYNIISSQSGNIIFHNDVVGNIIGATNTYYDGKTFTGSTFYNNEWIGDESELENKTIFDIINEKNININYGTSVKYITLKHNARFNIIGNGAQLITIDDRSHHNIIGECVTRVNMGKVCYNNIIYNQGYTDNIAPKTYPSDIILENKTMVCTIGDETSNNSTYNIHINQNCYKVQIPSGSENVTIGNNVWCVDNSNKLKNVLIKDDNAHMSIITEGESDVISNYTIESGTNVNDGKTDTEKVTLTLNYPNSSTPLIIYKDGNDIIEKLITSNNSQEAIVKENYNSLVTNPSFYPMPGKNGAAPTTNSYNGCLAIGGYKDYNGGICNADGSFAGGANCVANAICSIAYGVDVNTTKKSGKYGEVAFGMYNSSSGDTLFSLGNGDSINNRKNAFEVKKDGSGIFASNVTASAFYESSDERLKTFGDDIDVDLDKLAELRKSFFTFNSKPEKMELGVSAQEIQKLYPEIVNENEDGFLSVDYSKLSVIALKAIDKLNDKNKELEERLARIEKALNLQ